MAFTKIVGAGIHTLSNVHTHNVNSSGIITATSFVGPFNGSDGDFSGNVTIDGNLVVNGDTTTLNTTLREVELLRVDATSSTTAGIITQRGSGDILNLYDGSTEVLTVVDGGNVGIGTEIPGEALHLGDSKKIALGYGEDLKIYHTGSHGYIENTTNYTYYQSTQHHFKNAAGNQLQAVFQENNAVSLYYSGTEKFKTTGSGVSVTNGHLEQQYGGISSKIGYISGGAEAYYGTTSNHALFIGTAGANRIKIANNSAATSIGGSMVFNAMLTVQGDISGELLRLKATEGTSRLMVSGTNSNGIEMNLYDEAGGQKGILGVSGTEFFIKAPNNSAPLTFYTNDGSSIGERLRITSDGNIGIGITNPTEARVRIKGANNSTTQFDDGVMVTSANETVYKKYSWTGIEAKGGMHFEEATSSFGETMRITTDGNVGIGSAIPSAKLDVNGTSNFSGQIKVSDGTTAAPSVAAASDTNSGLYFAGADAVGLVAGGSRKLLANSDGITINNGDLAVNGGNLDVTEDIRHIGNTNTKIRFPAANQIAFETAAVERLRIRADGNVGIGSDNPQAEFEVFGYGAAASGATPILAIRNGYSGTADASNALKSELRFLHKNHNASHEFMAARIEASTTNNYSQLTHLSFYTAQSNNGTERLRISAMGDIYAGNEDGYAIFDNSTIRPRFQFRQGTGTNRGFALIETRGDANSMTLYLAKSREGPGTGVINSGDQLGSIAFAGADGTNQVTGAQILAYTSGTIAADRIPTNLSFYTHPDSTAGKKERLRITSGGKVSIGDDATHGLSAHSEGDDLVIGGAGWRGMTIYGQGGGGVIQFADDGSNRIGQIMYNHSDNSMMFRTNGNVDRLTINNSGMVQIGGAVENNGDIDLTNTRLTIKQSANNREDGIYLERTGERRGWLMFVGGSGSYNDAFCLSTNQMGTKTDVLAIDRGNRLAKLGGDVIIDSTNNGYGGLRIYDDSSGDYNVRYIAGRNQAATAHVFMDSGRSQNASPWTDATAAESVRLTRGSGISFKGDTDSTLGQHASDHLKIKTGGKDVAHFDNRKVLTAPKLNTKALVFSSCTNKWASQRNVLKFYMDFYTGNSSATYHFMRMISQPDWSFDDVTIKQVRYQYSPDSGDHVTRRFFTWYGSHYMDVINRNQRQVVGTTVTQSGSDYVMSENNVGTNSNWIVKRDNFGPGGAFKIHESANGGYYRDLWGSDYAISLSNYIGVRLEITVYNTVGVYDTSVFATASDFYPAAYGGTATQSAADSHTGGRGVWFNTTSNGTGSGTAPVLGIHQNTATGWSTGSNFFDTSL